MRFTMIFLASCVLLVGASNVFAQKKPSYADARAVYDEMDKIIMQTGVWHQRTYEQRIQFKRSSVALAKRAEAMFGFHGPAGSCAQAAVWHDDYVGNLNRIIDITQGGNTSVQQLLMMQRVAADFGQTRAQCKDYVESLDTPKKP